MTAPTIGASGMNFRTGSLAARSASPALLAREPGRAGTPVASPNRSSGGHLYATEQYVGVIAWHKS
jgi:hypothetical protein